MSEAILLTEQDVHSRIQEQITSWFGDDATLVSGPPEIRKLERSFFVRYQVQLGAGYTAVLLKVPRPESATTFLEALHSQRPRPSIIREFDMLVACKKRIGEIEPGIFSAVRPLACFPEWNAIAMEELNSVPLSSRKLRLPLVWPSSNTSFEELLYRAGKWLRMFHAELGSPADQTLSRIELQTELEEKLDILRSYNNSEAKIDRLRELFHSKFRSGEAIVPYVDLHGDFKPSNILIDAQARVASLDSKMRNRGACYKDLAKLYADLIGDRIAMQTAGLISRPLRWKNAILKGYFQSDSWNESLFNIYTALALLDKWIRDEGHVTNLSLMPTIIRSWFRRYFFQLITKILMAG